jgi:glycosyltransferase involved in cell wall biosynthesis
MGYRPVVITEQLGQPLPEREVVDGALVIRIPSSPQRTAAVQLRVAVQLARHLLAYRRTAAFAIVRTFTLPALVVGLMKRLRLIGYPTLLTAETGGNEDDIVALERRPGSRISKWLVNGNDRLNALCEMNMEHLVEFGYPSRKLTMIPNGIETGAWETTVAPERIERFLFLGRLDESKGIFDLVEALARLQELGRDATLLVAGAGPAEDRLRERVSKLGLDNAVEFAGLVPHEEIGTLFQQSDALVLPSRSEGLPLSVLEAAAHHRALIVSDVGDMRRLFGQSARIVPPGDVEALAEAMDDAMDDPNPIAPYEEVISAVSIETVAGKLERVLLEA